ncbi:segregation/condensation protein A [Tissierella sp. MB52-C2]|uniref:segregation and condensation protein A n=1 Tax=Tissierella sp. MB52-C2 TaxID=3070999 RepID=UPI00280BE718|nr:segregation/condensation protein A [Tissierella sp. MB52-C2]WMM26486.1 segregation/condensation protein A [Tissierella sp. MB52-C2]
MNYKVMIDAFEGPMDLLLHLIDKAEIDIYDIPISLIAEQFVQYIHQMEELNLEVTGEFLVMAATLLEIKSKLLLPNKTSSEDMQLELEEIDPRVELVRKLVEYKKYKNAAMELKNLENIYSKVYYKPKEDLIEFEDDEFQLEGLNIEILLKSINNIIKKRSRITLSLDVGEIQREEYTLEECMEKIKNHISAGEVLKFSSLINEESTKNEIITYFLSVLELIRMKHINVFQEEDFSDLNISRRIEEE